MSEMTEVDLLRKQRDDCADILAVDRAESRRLRSQVEELTRERDTLRKRTSNLLACKNCEERAEQAEAKLAEVVGALEEIQGESAMAQTASCHAIGLMATASLAAVRDQPNCYPPNHPDCCEPGEGPNDDTYREQPTQDIDRRYPCDKCGVLRTKTEGGTTFTVCDACWDERAETVEETHERWRQPTQEKP